MLKEFIMHAKWVNCSHCGCMTDQCYVNVTYNQGSMHDKLSLYNYTSLNQYCARVKARLSNIL